MVVWTRIWNLWLFGQGDRGCCGGRCGGGRPSGRPGGGSGGRGRFDGVGTGCIHSKGG